MNIYGTTPGDMYVLILHGLFFLSPDMLVRAVIIATKRALDENVFYMLVTGPNIDAERAVADKEYFFDCVRRLSSNPDLRFGEPKSLYSYRWV